MDELERMLRAESEAELPSPPDPRYTEAVVRRRMAAEAGLPAQRPAADCQAEGLPLLAGVGVVALLTGASLAMGRAPLWLAMFPIGAMFLFPLLLKRREPR